MIGGCRPFKAKQAGHGNVRRACLHLQHFQEHGRHSLHTSQQGVEWHIHRLKFKARSMHAKRLAAFAPVLVRPGWEIGATNTMVDPTSKKEKTDTSKNIQQLCATGLRNMGVSNGDVLLQ